MESRRIRFRSVRAYWVTLVVIGSYLLARLAGVLRGPEHARRIIEARHIRNARRIQRTIVRLKGLFIKVGQGFSILTNFLPPEFRTELEGLQDSLPPRPFSEMEPRLREELGPDWRARFVELDEEPLAAASIAQVYLARLASGERVAVKVQYPDIDDMVRKDLETFRRILRIVSFFVPAHGLDVVHREVAQMVLAELDFGAEARNIRQIAANIATRSKSRVSFPEVFSDHSTRAVLTTGYVEGTKVSDREALCAAGHDCGRVARTLVDVYCQQIFEDGLYHADPHPGNILVRADGTVVLLDFGAVATVRPQMRRGIALFLQAVLNRNTERIAEALRDMGFVTRDHDEEVLDRVVLYFHEKFQESIRLESFNLSDIKVDPEMGLEHLLALRRMDVGVGELSSVFQIPSEWILLERTVLLLTGLCTHLDPTVRPMEMIRPYLRDFVLSESGDLSAFLMDAGKDVLLQFVGLPSELRRFVHRAATGRLEVRVRGRQDGYRLLYRLGHQLIYTAIGITAASLAAVFHLHGERSLTEAATWVAAGAAVLLLGSMLRQRARK